MIFAAILAGGVGLRMKTKGLPKQFLPLGDMPVIMHSIKKFLACNRFEKIYVGINSSWTNFMEEMLHYHLSESEVRKVTLVEGGEDRNSSLVNVLNALGEEYGSNEDDVIITHDAVRAFVSDRIINENIDSVLEYGACGTAIATEDTIFYSKSGKSLDDVPNRAELYRAQTPQSFNVNLFKRLFFSLNEEEKKTLTEVCKIFLLNDLPVKIIEGETTNFKITTQTDYELAKMIADKM